jgi:hypothetical protein
MRVWIIPVDGRLTLDPSTGVPVGTKGVRRALNKYWRRCVQAGDVRIAPERQAQEANDG